jgi:hypothetical protein
VILVTRETKPAELALALSTLSHSVQTHGRKVSNELRATIRHIDPGERKHGVEDEAHAIKDLARIQKAPIVRIPNVGMGRFVLVTVK